MALLFMDGFDHYATADLAKKGWTAVGSGSSIVSNGGRRGGGCANTTYSSGWWLEKYLKSPVSTVITGLALLTTSLRNCYFLTLMSSSDTFQITFVANANGSISVWRGNAATLLGTTVIGLVSIGSWCYIESKVTISNSIGTVVLRVNGATVLSLTGIDTQESASDSTVQGIMLRGNADMNNQYFDDLYVCDTTGTTCNDFLGDVRIDTLLPNADGTYLAFTPSTGTTHCLLVDEAAPNTTDYNSGLNPGDRDSYNLANLTPLVSQTIYGVQVNAAVLKDDAGSKSAAPFIRSGTTDADGTTAALGTSQTYITQIAELNPNGNIAWTESAVNAMEAGVVVTA